ncbi:hypothetical protein [Primorskyibacter sp. 2E233]|uniref:hypothetical protein n=1 Tax=Primorskyibacter sp. 2E233 TaxID=3413431 RepID=UPI003BF3958E
MTTPIVTQGTVITCPHSIPATIMAGGSKLLVAGTPAAVQGDKGMVSGCPFTLPNGKPQPCVTAELTKAASKVQTGGKPVLLLNPSDMCKSGDQITNGPVIWSSPQTKVLAT